MDDHARVAQEWVQSIPIFGCEQDAIRGFERKRLHTLERLIELRERVLEEHVHPDEESQRHTGNDDHPGQELTVAIPLAQSDK